MHVLKKILFLLSPIIIYGFITAIYFGWLLYPDIDHRVIGDSSDVYGEMWQLNWWYYAFSHKLPLFFTHILWAPFGYNLVFSQSKPLLGFLLAPLISTASIVATYNYLVLSSMIFSAYTAFLLCWYCSKNWVGSLFGGYFFGFSTYMLSQSLAHVCFTAVFLLPLLSLVSVMFYQRKIKKLNFIFCYVFLLTAQFYINPEAAVIFLIFTFVGILLGSFTFERPSLVRWVKPWLLACVVTLLLIAPLLYNFFHSPRPDYLKDNISNSLPLFNFFVPTVVTALFGNVLSALHMSYSLNYYESGGYLGLPLIAILVIYIREHWKTPVGKWLIRMGAFAALFSMGPFLHLLRDSLHLPLPWYLFSHFPVLRPITPARFSLMLWLIISVVIPLWFARSKLHKLIKYGLVFLSAIFIFPSVFTHPEIWATSIHIPAYIEKNKYQQDIAKNDVAMIITRDCHNMLWQIESGGWFKLTNGCTGGNPPEIATYPILRLLNAQKFSAISKAQFHDYLSLTGAKIIIVEPDMYPTWQAFLNSMGFSFVLRDGVYINRDF